MNKDELACFCQENPIIFNHKVQYKISMDVDIYSRLFWLDGFLKNSSSSNKTS